MRIGEAFGLTLTCRVLETDKATVVPNVSNIEPTSLQLTPFEVVGGTRHEDIVRPPWRYLQFDILFDCSVKSSSAVTSRFLRRT